MSHVEHMRTSLSTTALALGVGAWLAGGGTAWSFYNPSTGRWLNRDPIAEGGGAGLYAYVRNAPTIQDDALGLLPAPVKWPKAPNCGPCKWLGKQDDVIGESDLGQGKVLEEPPGLWYEGRAQSCAECGEGFLKYNVVDKKCSAFITIRFDYKPDQTPKGATQTLWEHESIHVHIGVNAFVKTKELFQKNLKPCVHKDCDTDRLLFVLKMQQAIAADADAQNADLQALDMPWDPEWKRSAAKSKEEKRQLEAAADIYKKQWEECEKRKARP
jgi:hypothetical protein